MTTGERIRYVRKLRRLTQAQLAEMTGIHPVSIRKYEIGIMEPQLEQIQRIALALNVNANVLIGFDSMPMKIETIGDVLSVLMMLHRSKLIMISGERDEKTSKLKAETVSLVPNPALTKLMNLSVHRGKTNTKAEIDSFSLLIKDPNILKFIISWEQMLLIKADMAETAENEPEGADQFITETLTNSIRTMEELELFMQSINTPLDEYVPSDSALLDFVPVFAGPLQQD